MKQQLTQERLKQLLHYCPESGTLTRKTTTSSRSQAGQRTGNIGQQRGYRLLSVDNKQYQAHRLIYLLQTGTWPKTIDHINGDKADNRWSNLRSVTQQQNVHNQKIRTNNSSGYKGVSFDKRAKKFEACIKLNYKKIFLGYFEDPKLAHEAYCKAAQEHFGEFANFG